MRLHLLISIGIIIFLTGELLRDVDAKYNPETTISCEVDPNGRQAQTIPVGAKGDLGVSESDRFIYCKARTVFGDGNNMQAKLIETSPAYAITDSDYITAEAGLDYEHVSLRYDALKGDSDEGFIVPIIQDDKVEGPELFQVNVYTLFNPPFGSTTMRRRKRDNTHPFDTRDTKGAAAATFPCTTILIIDDDVAFYCDCALYVVDESSTSITFKVRREGLLQSSQSLVIRTQDMTATGGEDYQDLAGGMTLGFTDAVTETVEGSIDIYDDYKLEGPESFKILLSLPSVGSITQPAEAVVVITDSDPSVATTGSYTFDKEHYVITEGDLASIQVCRENTRVNAADLVLQLRDVDAQSPHDFDGTNTGRITFNNNALKSNQIQIQTIEDSQVERQESFELVLLSGNVEISTATVWIRDDDVRYCFDSKAFVVSEGDESASLNIVKEGDLQDITELTVYTSDSDAVSGTDYTRYTTSTLVIAKGESVTEIQIPIGNDEDWEPVECFKVHIEDGDGNMICNATVLIKDDDAMCNPSCKNGATCVSPNTCLCTTDFTGPTCETALCDPACANGGSCIGSNICLCQSLYTGPTCELALCDPPCSSGGTCIASNTCLCPSLYTGPTCETVLCHDRCQNGGICIPYTNTCRCPPGFGGESCENSLCLSPCENGGVCSAKGNCLCPSGFTGSQCEIIQLPTTTDTFTSVIEGLLGITDMNGVPAVYNPDMNVAGSPEREALLAMIGPLLFNALVNDVADLIAVRFGLVTPGSINIQYEVVLPSNSQSTAADVDNGIATLITTAPLSGVTINPDTSSTFTRPRVVCPAGYCKNGGSCMADSTGSRSVCMCTPSYTGSQCEENINDLSEGEIAGITVGVIGFFLLLLLVAVTFCAFMRYKQINIEQTSYPNTETLDMASSPYSYPRENVISTQNQLMF